jgi:hypothetical protein
MSISRREAFTRVGVAAGGVGLLALFGRWLKDSPSSEWPTDQEAILAKAESLPYLRGSKIKSTVFFRKIQWEMEQLKNLQGRGSPADDSIWTNSVDIESVVKKMSSVGFAGGRLVILPFEIINAAGVYDWTSMDVALFLMKHNGLRADLSAGPMDHPGDNGIRFPKHLEDLLKSEAQDRGQKQITISLSKDPNMPESSAAIRDFNLEYWQLFLDKYGNDPKIDDLYIANEWPDTDSVEQVPGVLVNVHAELMMELIKMAKMSTKRIALNTNIDARDLPKIRSTLGPLLSELGDQGVLAFDKYYTRERNQQGYPEALQAVRSIYSHTLVKFQELQAEPWLEEFAGLPWAQTYSEHPDLIEHYFERVFPPTLESIVVPSRITDIGLYGLPAWSVLGQMGYDFPWRMFRAMANGMNN